MTPGWFLIASVVPSLVLAGVLVWMTRVSTDDAEWERVAREIQANQRETAVLQLETARMERTLAELRLEQALAERADAPLLERAERLP